MSLNRELNVLSHEVVVAVLSSNPLSRALGGELAQTLDRLDIVLALVAGQR